MLAGLLQIVAVQHENEFVAGTHIKPGKWQVGECPLQYVTVMADLDDQHAILGEMFCRLCEDDACGIESVMAAAESRIGNEIARLGGDCAHVHGESLGAKHDDVAGEAWLHGTFTYILYRRPAK